jgi:hypothetical protein
MEGHERMDMDPGAISPKREAGRPHERYPGESADAARVEEEMTGELGRRAESLGDSLRSFDKEMDGAEKTLEKVKDPKKREEFRSTLAALRGRAGGAGNMLRGAVTGLALLAGGIGVGKGMDDERRDAAMVEMAKQTGAAEAENRMLREQLAKRDEAAAARSEGGDKNVDRAMGSLEKQNAELRKQLERMANDLAQLRKERDDANAKVLAEKEKGIVTQDALMKQQAVSGNLQTLYEKMKNLIDQSGDPKLKEDAERFLSAYE